MHGCTLAKESGSGVVKRTRGLTAKSVALGVQGSRHGWDLGVGVKGLQKKIVGKKPLAGWRGRARAGCLSFVVVKLLVALRLASDNADKGGL